MKDIIIRPIQDSDSYEEITHLVRTAYKALLDKGFRYWGTYQTVDDTKRRLSEGEGYLAESSGKIIGVIIFKEKNHSPEETPWYDNEDVCFFSQFAVYPEYQKSGLGSEMMNFVEQLAIDKGFNHIALDTCEDAKGLISYYEKRGYSFVEYIQWNPEYVNYRSVILSKVLTP